MISRLVTLGRQAGLRGLFAGLGPRMIMTAGLVSGQFMIYGAIKDGTSLFFVFAFKVGFRDGGQVDGWWLSGVARFQVPGLAAEFCSCTLPTDYL